MLYATISADIVDNTKMTAEDTIRMNKLQSDFLEPMKRMSKVSWGRVVKGDAFDGIEVKWAYGKEEERPSKSPCLGRLVEIHCKDNAFLIKFGIFSKGNLFIL